MGIVVDTSVLIALERTRPLPTVTSLRGLGADLHIAAITIAELRSGELLADSEGRRVLREAFSKLVRTHCRVIPFGEREAEIFADIYVQLRRAGTPVGEHDIQIAATALAHGHSVMTANTAEFSRVPGLTVLAAL